jgi:hypothetical protein
MRQSPKYLLAQTSKSFLVLFFKKEQLPAAPIRPGTRPGNIPQTTMHAREQGFTYRLALICCVYGAAWPCRLDFAWRGICP